jgi:hypothetical protein
LVVVEEVEEQIFPDLIKMVQVAGLVDLEQALLLSRQEYMQ